MLHRSSWAVSLVLVLAGCVASTSDGLPRPSAMGDADGVAVAGSVISDELFPVPNALVTLGSLAPTTTDEAGKFLVVGVPIQDDYTLTVNATGYEPFSMQLDVPGPVDALQIPLKGIPGQSPYTATYIHVGFDACSFSAVYSAGPAPGACPFGDGDTAFKVEVGDLWKAGVHELGWQSSEDMIFASSVSTEDPNHGDHQAGCLTGTDSSGNPYHDWCPAMIWGQSPLRILVRPNDTEYAKAYAIDGKEVWPGGENYTSFIFSSYSGYAQQEINSTFYDGCVVINRQFSVPEKWGCPFGIGYSLGIKITYYHTTFYVQAPAGRLEDFTAMPDN